MNKLFGFLLVSLWLVCSCSSTKTVAEKENIKKETAQRVVQLVNGNHYQISVDYVHPQYMEPKFLSREYSVTIKGDSISSILPFYGRAERVSFDYESPLDFDSKIIKYKVTHPKADLTRIVLSTKNKSELFDYTIDVYDNASVQMRVKGFERDYNDFTGSIDAIKE